MDKDTGKLHSQDCIALSAIAGQSGYAVLWAIARREVRNLELEAMEVDPSKRDEVLAKQAVAHAAGTFCNRLLKAIGEALEQVDKKPPVPLSAEEQKIADQAEVLDFTAGARRPRIVEAS